MWTHTSYNTIQLRIRLQKLSQAELRLQYHLLASPKATGATRDQMLCNHSKERRYISPNTLGHVYKLHLLYIKYLSIYMNVKFNSHIKVQQFIHYFSTLIQHLFYLYLSQLIKYYVTPPFLISFFLEIYILGCPPNIFLFKTLALLSKGHCGSFS